jgi:hypothetical protein
MRYRAQQPQIVARISTAQHRNVNLLAELSLPGLRQWSRIICRSYSLGKLRNSHKPRRLMSLRRPSEPVL